MPENERRELLSKAEASLAIEGLTLTNEDRELILQSLRGDIDDAAFVQRSAKPSR
jgi:hypothetical protein